MDNVWLRFIIIGHPPKQWSGKKQMTTINETIPIVHGNSLKLSLNGNYWSLPLNYLHHVMRSTTVIMHSTVVSFCCANLGINTAVINWLAMTSLNCPSFKADRIWKLTDPLWTQFMEELGTIKIIIPLKISLILSDCIKCPYHFKAKTNFLFVGTSKSVYHKNKLISYHCPIINPIVYCNQEMLISNSGSK